MDYVIKDMLHMGAVSAARQLLGWKLVHESAIGMTSGYIVETEAYTIEDPASHSYAGPTKRNAPMFSAAGTVYVYFTYGMHYCVNIVTGDKDHGQAVLIRALQPVDGLDIMQGRRHVVQPENLTNGPAKLVQAMGITMEHNNTQVFDGSLRLEKGITPRLVIETTRIGIKKAVKQPWRFYIADNPFVSRQ